MIDFGGLGRLHEKGQQNTVTVGNTFPLPPLAAKIGQCKPWSNAEHETLIELKHEGKIGADIGEKISSRALYDCANEWRSRRKSAWYSQHFS